MSYLRSLCLVAYSVVQHILCFAFVLLSPPINNSTINCAKPDSVLQCM